MIIVLMKREFVALLFFGLYLRLNYSFAPFPPFRPPPPRPQTVSDDRRLNINVYGQAHCGPVYGVPVFWLQIATEGFALFNHSGFDYTSRKPI